MLARLQVSCMLAQILAPLTFVGARVGEVLLSLFTMGEDIKAQRG